MANPQPSGETQPNPPRFRWLKRIGLLTLLLMLALLGLRFAWGHRAQSQLDAAVQAIRDEGSPIDRSDLPPPIPPDADVAVTHLTEAMDRWPRFSGLLITETAWYQQTQFSNTPTQLVDPVPDTNAYLDQIENDVMPHLRAAVACEYAGWHLQFADPPWMTLIPHLLDLRRLVRLMQETAVRSLEVLRYDLYFELVLQSYRLAQLAELESHSSIGHLVRISIDALAGGILMDTLHQWDPAAPYAGTEQARQLLNALLDEAPYRQGLVEALRADRWSFHVGMLWLLDHPSELHQHFFDSDVPFIVIRVALPVAKPVAIQDIRFGIDYYSRMIEAFRDTSNLPEWSTSVSQDPAWSAFEKSDFVHLFSQTMTGGVGATVRTHYQQLAHRRLTAIALALHLYRAEHGRFPDRLDELVPDLLPAVPIDPLASDGRPIAYHPEGLPLIDSNIVSRAYNQPLPDNLPFSVERYPMLYSVGVDGIDDSGLVYFDRLTGELDGRNGLGYDDYSDLPLLFSTQPEPLPSP